MEGANENRPGRSPGGVERDYSIETRGRPAAARQSATAKYADRVFPLLGENDLFFRLENHAELFAERPLVTIPAGHISAMWHSASMRDHILSILAYIARREAL